MSHAGGLQIDQPASDLLVPLLLQVALHPSFHEHLRHSVKIHDASHLQDSCFVVWLLEEFEPGSHPAGAHVDALFVQIQLSQQLLHRLRRRDRKSTYSVRTENESVTETESCCDEPPDLSLIVADKHGSVTFHNRGRERLEMTPEVTQSHVLRITCERDTKAVYLFSKFKSGR